jgi:hypothetical protein
MRDSRPSADSIAQRTRTAQELIGLAEEAALSLLAEAEAEARRYLEETKEYADRFGRERARIVSDASDTLLAQAERVKSESRSLLAALAEVSRRAGELDDRAA